MTAFDKLASCQVDIEKFVIYKFSHMKVSAIHYRYAIAWIHYLIHIEAVQVSYVLNLHIVLNGHSWWLIIHTDRDAAVGSLRN